MRAVHGLPPKGLVRVVCSFAGLQVIPMVCGIGADEGGKGEGRDEDVGEVHIRQIEKLDIAAQELQYI